MCKESVCIKALKAHGEKAIISANKLKMVNRELKIQKDKDFVYIPLVRQPEKNEVETIEKQIPDYEISVHIFPERKKKVTTLVELLEGTFPSHLLASLPRAIDFIGDIAIIEIPPELDAYKSIVGKAILETHKNVQTVLAKAGTVSGTYRLRKFNIIAGERKTETIHKEYGCKYHVDIAKAYFSPRLSHEHNRVASLVREGETIFDLFAGVGPFAILIAKNHENVEVYAIDVNPQAIELLKKNVRLNRVMEEVHPILGNAKQIVKKKFCGVADRVIMNLPEKAMDFVDVACKAIKPIGGIVHFYSFVNTLNTLEDAKLCFADTVEKSGRKVEKILVSKFVRATAPYEWQAVLDAKIH